MLYSEYDWVLEPLPENNAKEAYATRLAELVLAIHHSSASSRYGKYVRDLYSQVKEKAR